MNLEKEKQNEKLNLDILDRTPISKLLTYTAEELFTLKEQARVDFEKSKYRKQWIDGVIELKYKTTINDFYKTAQDYFSSEPIKEMDSFNRELTTFEIADPDNPNNRIEVEFYRGYSETFNKYQIKKRFRLIKNTKNTKKSETR